MIEFKITKIHGVAAQSNVKVTTIPYVEITNFTVQGRFTEQGIKGIRSNAEVTGHPMDGKIPKMDINQLIAEYEEATYKLTPDPSLFDDNTPIGTGIKELLKDFEGLEIKKPIFAGEENPMRVPSDNVSEERYGVNPRKDAERIRNILGSDADRFLNIGARPAAITDENDPNPN